MSAALWDTSGQRLFHIHYIWYELSHAQYWFANKGFPILLTCERLLSCVSFLVSDEVWLLCHNLCIQKIFLQCEFTNGLGGFPSDYRIFTIITVKKLLSWWVLWCLMTYSIHIHCTQKVSLECEDALVQWDWSCSWKYSRIPYRPSHFPPAIISLLSEVWHQKRSSPHSQSSSPM